MRLFSRSYKTTAAIVIIFVLLLDFLRLSFVSAEAAPYDYVIKNGRIMNPSTGHDLQGYSLAISNGRIARISKEDMKAKRVIDAGGLVVSPGFIDLISYEPTSVGIKLKVFDGVTSNLLMHGGTDNAKSWYASKKKQGQVINYGASSFIMVMRKKYVGSSVDAVLKTDAQINGLANDVRRNIKDGALGVSFSFEYVPGTQKNEIIPLLKIAREYEVPTFYHTRYSSLNPPNDGPAGIREVIAYAKETGAAVHIMHINSTGGTGHMEEALKLCEEAREAGIDITSDIYSYNSWATYLGSARFRTGWQERFGITYSDLQIGGTGTFITKNTFGNYRKQNVLVYAHDSIPEEDMVMSLKDPTVMIGSDTIITGGNNHPRGAGNYARLFAKYVREEKAISLMEAVSKCTYQPAKRMESAAPSMKRKGRLEVGCDADITIFNPDTIKDMATVQNVFAASKGVEYVFVNGVLIKDKAVYNSSLKPGKAVMSHFVDKGSPYEVKTLKTQIDGSQLPDLEMSYDGEKAMLPVSFLESAGMPVEDRLDGNIAVDGDIELCIGSAAAKKAGEQLELKTGPVIYNGGICLEYEDMKQILSTRYTVADEEGVLKLTSPEPAPPEPTSAEPAPPEPTSGEPETEPVE